MGPLSKMDLYPAFLLLLLALAAQSQPLGNNGADNGSNGGTKTINCPPGTAMASACSGTHCEVSCGSEKVEMECPQGGINIEGSTVTCGKKWEPEACFPFCDKEGQPMNNGGTSRQARSSGDQKTVDCPPGSSMASSCSGTHCVVTCGNGKKVEMECPDEWININGSTATCGKKPDCFPFCDKEGQPLKGCLPGSPGFPFC